MVDKKIVDFLKDWIIRYLKNKDIITKKIIGIQENKEGFSISRADRVTEFFIEPFFNELGFLENMKQKEHKAIVCFHTKKNFDALITKWKDFVDVGRNFTIYFVNPFSKLDRVLILNPHTHDLISDSDSLETGLKTMSESVEFTTEDEVKKIINS